MKRLGVIHSADEFEPKSIENAVRDRYTLVAERGCGSNASEPDECCGESLASGLYIDDQLSAVNDETLAASAGCGNPIALSEVRTGETVLDLGSGGGIDCFLAATAVGSSGRVIGVDMTHAMIDLARRNAEQLGVENVVFKLGKIEALPEPDDSIDLVMSNCVIALAPNKDLVFDEIYRVLKPGGRFVIADMVVTQELPESVRHSAAEWVACVGGADLLSRYLSRINRAGFADVKILSAVPMPPRDDGSGWAEAVHSVTVRGWKPNPIN